MMKLKDFLKIPFARIISVGGDPVEQAFDVEDVSEDDVHYPTVDELIKFSPVITHELVSLEKYQFNSETQMIKHGPSGYLFRVEASNGQVMIVEACACLPIPVFGYAIQN